MFYTLQNSNLLLLRPEHSYELNDIQEVLDSLERLKTSPTAARLVKKFNDGSILISFNNSEHREEGLQTLKNLYFLIHKDL